MKIAERRQGQRGGRARVASSSAGSALTFFFASALLSHSCVVPSASNAEELAPDVSEEAVASSSAALVVDDARWQAMLLVAGSPPPPDLPAGLVAARSERSASALGLVAETLESEEAEAFLATLQALFLDEETPDLLWCAAARASAALKLEAVAPVFAVNLESMRPARRVAAADALHQMRGAWFESSAQALGQLSAGSAPTVEHLANLEAATARVREYAAELYALDSVRATAALSDADPQLRVLAARALSQAFASSAPDEAFDPARARAALLKQLQVEEHPLPLFALVSAFIEQLGSTDICTYDARAFSTALHARAAHCDVTLIAAVAHGLARMPLDPELPIRDEAGVPDACSMALAAEALESLLIEWLRPGRLVDVDSLASALRSLETLFERPQSPATRPELCGVLLDAIEDSIRAPSIRTGAARALALVGRPEDLPRLAACLDEAPTDVAYELVATVTKLVEGVEVSSESAIAARDALVAMLSHDEASLRRRALSLLATAPLSPLAETTDARLFLRVLEQGLPAEDSAVILELLSRRRDPALVEAILSSSAFDRLADPASGAAGFLTAALGKLASGDGQRTFAVASQLMGAAGVVDRVQRLRNALALHAALSDEVAESFEPEQHAAIVMWSLEFREAAGSLAGLMTDDVSTSFLERLIEVHLERCAEDSERPRWAHPTALLLADLFDALEFNPNDGVRAGFAGRTRGNFERALGYARSTPDQVDDLLVLRDRARFFVAAGETFKAVRDYRDVVRLEGELVSGPDVPTSVLGLTDLRDAAELAAIDGMFEADALPSAVDLTLALISIEAWFSEPHGVRLEDLSSLVERVGGSEPLRARVRPLFVGLPTLDIDPVDAVLPTGVPWLGLEGDTELLEVLRALAAALDAPLAELSSEADEAEEAEEAGETEESEEESSEVPERRS